MKKLGLSILCLTISAAVSLGIIEASREAHAGPGIALMQATVPVAIEPMPDAAPQDAVQAPAPVEAGSAAVVTTTTTAPTVLPDPIESTGESVSLLWKLYKAGHLIPALFVLAFFGLKLAQRWIAWLKTGYRKLLVASALAGLAMLAERAANGESPNIMMIMGAIGAAWTLYIKGGPAEAETVKA